jgi:Ca2+-transporting ATPase
MATINKRGEDFILYEKGAPEIVLEKSKTFYHKGEFVSLSKDHCRSIMRTFEKMTAMGFRLIAVAYRDLKLDDLNNVSYPDWASVDKDLVFVGLVALKDPLRPDAKDTIRAAKEAGIRPVIITGDHYLIASAIGKEIGLNIDKDAIISGDDLDKMDDKELRKRCAKISVYARVSPHHKLRIVNALRMRGEVVAMAGDGVNDAPALKAADVGIALGNGSDVAKEASDIILLNNNFKVIVLAVEEGRRILSNLRRVVTYLTSDSFCEIVLVTGSILIGAPLPLLPVHILWLNIIHDGMPNFALSFEKSTKKMMERRPDKRSASLLTPEMKAIIFFVGMVVNVAIFIFFFWMYRLGVAIDYLRTLVFAILGVKSLLAIFALRSLSRPIWLMNPFGNPYLWAAVGASTFLFLVAIYWLPLQLLLSTVPLQAKDWLFVFLFSFINLLLIEGVKVFYSSKSKK